MSKLIAAPISRNEIRNFTREFRKIIGLDNKLHIDIIRILEHVLPSVFPDMEYMYVPVEEMSGIHGFTDTYESVNNHSRGCLSRCIK